MDKHLQIPGPGISVFRDREVPRLAGSSCHQHRWYFVLSQGCHVRLRTSAVNMRCGDGLFIIPPSCPVSCLEFIEGFSGLVERHCESERKLGFYARELGITAKYLSAVVSESTGNPAGRWIGEYAVWHAKRLLSERGMVVGEVASRMGFSHMSAFSKYFKRFAGVSPKEFKRSCPPG